jgi:hypothetical protein
MSCTTLRVWQDEKDSAAEIVETEGDQPGGVWRSKSEEPGHADVPFVLIRANDWLLCSRERAGISGLGGLTFPSQSQRTRIQPRLWVIELAIILEPAKSLRLQQSAMILLLVISGGQSGRPHKLNSCN